MTGTKGGGVAGKTPFDIATSGQEEEEGGEAGLLSDIVKLLSSEVQMMVERLGCSNQWEKLVDYADLVVRGEKVVEMAEVQEFVDNLWNGVEVEEGVTQ